jgi:hypothetical protein
MKVTLCHISKQCGLDVSHVTVVFFFILFGHMTLLLLFLLHLVKIIVEIILKTYLC